MFVIVLCLLWSLKGLEMHINCVATIWYGASNGCFNCTWSILNKDNHNNNNNNKNKDNNNYYYYCACTCRSIVVSLGKVASFEDDHGQRVGGGLVTQGEQQLASARGLLWRDGEGGGGHVVFSMLLIEAKRFTFYD